MHEFVETKQYYTHNRKSKLNSQINRSDILDLLTENTTYSVYTRSQIISLSRHHVLVRNTLGLHDIDIGEVRLLSEPVDNQISEYIIKVINIEQLFNKLNLNTNSQAHLDYFVTHLTLPDKPNFETLDNRKILIIGDKNYIIYFYNMCLIKLREFCETEQIKQKTYDRQSKEEQLRRIMSTENKVAMKLPLFYKEAMLEKMAYVPSLSYLLNEYTDDFEVVFYTTDPLIKISQFQELLNFQEEKIKLEDEVKDIISNTEHKSSLDDIARKSQIVNIFAKIDGIWHNNPRRRIWKQTGNLPFLYGGSSEFERFQQIGQSVH